jgi:glycosyltransferase involved in cell wall biosynthesis
MKISLVVNTLNEEAHIAGCLASAAGFADEMIVADMHSTDRTAELARSAGAAVHLIPRAPFVDPARNAALELATGDWILILDADERLTPACAARLKQAAEKDEAEVVRVPFEVHMCGAVVRYSGWQNTYRKIFFKRGCLKFPDTEAHAEPQVAGRQKDLSAEYALPHYNYRDLSHFVEKLNSYTTGEALKIRRQGRPVTPVRGVYWGLRHFFRRYIIQQGWRDGLLGLALCGCMGFYWFLAFCKAWEMDRRK